MSGDEMNTEVPSEQAARELEERILEARIVLELERVPDLSVSIPEDFAARVAAQVPNRKAVASGPASHYGYTLMGVSLVVLFVAMLVLAARGFGSSTIGLAVEWSLFIQFLAITVWMGTRRWRST